MSTSLWLAALALLLAFSYRTYRGFRQNLTAAKQSGLPYVWIPIHQAHPLWVMTNRLFVPWLELLPRSWTYPWIVFLKPDFVWYGKYQLFRDIGGDVIILFSPFHLQVCVGNAEAIHEITTRKNDFPKDLRLYERLALFGPNMVTADGPLWRYHRKLVSPSFTESNIATVWQESLQQAQIMLAGWIPDGAKTSSAVWDLNDATTTLSLHVISRAGFGQRLHWPHEQVRVSVPAGYSMSYKNSLEIVLRNSGLILLLPSWLLRNLPFKLTKETYEAFTDWKKYQQNMYLAKVEELKAGEARVGVDLLGALVEGAEVMQPPKHPVGDAVSNKDAGPQKESPPTGLALSEAEILSNIFVLILAGHETSASTIFFSTLLLAMHWSSQEHLQKDLDEIFGDVPVSDWKYETYISSLTGSTCGAVMNEALRLIPPIVGIPKSTLAEKPVKLSFEGQEFTIPAGANIMLHPSIAGSNPRYWPHTVPEDLNEFHPERWLLNTNDRELGRLEKQRTRSSNPAQRQDDQTGNDNTEPYTSASLFRPPRGSYIPFSDGQRSCVGRRFAQVEIVAVLAIIFKHWSVELDVSQWMSNETLSAATKDEKQGVWEKAEAKARDLLANGMFTIISLQMRSGQVPLRFVRRGHENFKMG